LYVHVIDGCFGILAKVLINQGCEKIMVDHYNMSKKLLKAPRLEERVVQTIKRGFTSII